MRERGIIFNAEMVRAILDGRKTQTRRIIKPQPELTKGSGFSWNGAVYGAGSDDAETNRNFAHVKCPYGQLGDRLWVRETFTGHYLDDDQIQDIKDGRDKADDLCEYRADYPDGHHGYHASDGWTPSIHMPRWASRIVLEITGIRVERLNDISEADARSEGVHPMKVAAEELVGAKLAFAELWSSIYGFDSWKANPFVWVVEFKRVEQQP